MQVETPPNQPRLASETDRSPRSTVLGVLPQFAQHLYGRARGSPLARRVVKGTFWSVAGTSVSRGMGLLASIVVARSLGKAGFGELGIIQGTAGMFGVLAGFGLGTTATKYVAEFRNTDGPRVGRIIALSSALSWASSGLMTIALFFSSGWLASATLNTPLLAPQLRIASLLLLLGGINGAQTGVLSGFEAFRSVAGINLAVGLFSFPCLVIGVHFAGLTGAVWGLVANLALNCLLNFVCVRREVCRQGVTIEWRRFTAELPLVWRFSVPVTLVSLVMVPTNWWTSTMLATSRHGYAALGEFSAASQWRNFVTVLPMMLAGVAIPMLSNLHGKRDGVGYRRVLFSNLCVVAVLAGLAAAGIVLFAGLIAISYGSGFANSAPVIRWMAISGFLIAINSVVGTAITSLGRVWAGLVFCILCSLVLVGCAYGLVPRYGAVGLAIANVLAYLAHSFWQGAFLWKAARP